MQEPTKSLDVQFDSLATRHLRTASMIFAILFVLHAPTDQEIFVDPKNVLGVLHSLRSFIALAVCCLGSFGLLAYHYEVLHVTVEGIEYRRLGFRLHASWTQVIACLGSAGNTLPRVVSIRLPTPEGELSHLSDRWRQRWAPQGLVHIGEHWKNGTRLVGIIFECSVSRYQAGGGGQESTDQVTNRDVSVCQAVVNQESQHAPSPDQHNRKSGSDITWQDVFPGVKAVLDRITKLRQFWKTRSAITAGEQPWFLTKNERQQRGLMEPWPFNLFQSMLSAGAAWILAMVGVYVLTRRDWYYGFDVFFDATLTPIALALACYTAAGASISLEHQTPELLRRARMAYLYLDGAYGLLPQAIASIGYIAALEMGLGTRSQRPTAFLVYLVALSGVFYVNQVLIPRTLIGLRQHRQSRVSQDRPLWRNYFFAMQVSFPIIVLGLDGLYERVGGFANLSRWIWLLLIDWSHETIERLHGVMS